MKITNLIKYSMICGLFFLGACTHENVKVVKAVKLNEPIIKGVKNNPGMVSL